ncbi:hypothetical protein NUW54_g3870 [Trametes sanguinea]|uniref:Uncharacterized protein n=1 Tax=Trametes sanguinea TaxID=158606 RepID=A0ACC1Q214_9APHY|nr:hypothetical protein NUW54_g3870 [Trametes sanguinea]
MLLHGFVRDASLSVLGNWSGKGRDAASAVQYIELESGGCHVPFSAQLRALRNVREVIEMRAGAAFDADVGDDDCIRLERRVFTKVRTTARGVESVRLTDVNDPFRRARKIAAMWRVDHVVTTILRRPSGDHIAVSSDVITVGDFVEVTATAHVELIRSRKRRGAKVTFQMHEVVRLYSAREVAGLYKRPSTESDGAAATGARACRVISIARVRGGAGAGDVTMKPLSE